MATVNDLLATKGTKVVSVGPEATVLNAAIVMNEHRIGAVVVKDGERVVGMFTERDVLQRVVGPQRDPAQTRVADVMTSEIMCCTNEIVPAASRFCSNQASPNTCACSEVTTSLSPSPLMSYTHISAPPGAPRPF